MAGARQGALRRRQSKIPGPAWHRIEAAGLAPADHIVLAPVYLREIDQERQALRASIEQTIQSLQNPSTPDGSTLGVTPGSDGKLGTSDDGTACSASCATLYAKYKVYVALLEPRQDAGGNPLPSAFDKLSDELRDDLFGFLPAFLDTIENVSNKLNEPLSPGSEAFNLNKAELATLFAPMTNWADDLTTIDYATLTAALLPDWLQQLQAALNAVGVNIQVPSLLEAALDPVIQPVKDAIRTYAIDLAQQTVGDLVDQYTAKAPATKLEYQGRLEAAAAPGLGGTALDHLYDSGLYAHSFNIAATALANHEIVLPEGDDPVGIGPASFDASTRPGCSRACATICVPQYFRWAFRRPRRARCSQRERRHSSPMSRTTARGVPRRSVSMFSAAPTRQLSLDGRAGLLADPAHRGSAVSHLPARPRRDASDLPLHLGRRTAPSATGMGGTGGQAEPAAA
jgi:hypothetical protein